jgi:hypothetical protein
MNTSSLPSRDNMLRSVKWDFDATVELNKCIRLLEQTVVESENINADSMDYENTDHSISYKYMDMIVRILILFNN